MRVLVVDAIAPEGLAYLRERSIQVGSPSPRARRCTRAVTAVPERVISPS